MDEIDFSDLNESFFICCMTEEIMSFMCRGRWEWDDNIFLPGHDMDRPDFQKCEDPLSYLSPDDWAGVYDSAIARLNDLGVFAHSNEEFWLFDDLNDPENFLIDRKKTRVDFRGLWRWHTRNEPDLKGLDEIPTEETSV
jgi:hypothetical protein